MNLIEDLKYQFRNGDMITRLIFANLLLFLVIIIAGIIQGPFLNNYGNGNFLLKEILAMPYEPKKLLFKPWTLVTYNFTHLRFFHILFNMIWLYFFGRVFVDFLGNKKALPVYLLGGVFGGLISFLAFLLPGLHVEAGVPLIGASASVMAIVWATVSIAPNYTFHLFLLGPIKIKWIAFLYLILDLLTLATYNPELSNNAGGSLAHIGGAIFGFLFVKLLYKGVDVSDGMNNVGGKIQDLLKRRPKPKMVYKNEDAIYKKSKMVSKKEEYDTGNKQEKVDAILDKISEKGYDSLSKEEKEFLFSVSEE